MNKAKLIAISGLCCAVCTGCMLLCALPAMRIFMLVLGVVAALAAAIPLVLDSQNVAFSLLIWLASSILGVFFGLANITYVAPIALFCIPFAIVKTYGEKPKKAQAEVKTVLDDPFDDQKKVLQVQVRRQTKISPVVRWVLYYIFLEIALGATVLLTYLFAKPLFETMTSTVWFYVALALAQGIVLPYNLLMNGCLAIAKKMVAKSLGNN